MTYPCHDVLEVVNQFQSSLLRCFHCDGMTYESDGKRVKFQSSLLRCFHCDDYADDWTDKLSGQFQSSLLRCFHCDMRKPFASGIWLSVSILFIEVFPL